MPNQGETSAQRRRRMALKLCNIEMPIKTYFALRRYCQDNGISIVKQCNLWIAQKLRDHQYLPPLRDKDE